MKFVLQQCTSYSQIQSSNVLSQNIKRLIVISQQQQKMIHTCHYIFQGEVLSVWEERKDRHHLLTLYGQRNKGLKESFFMKHPSTETASLLLTFDHTDVAQMSRHLDHTNPPLAFDTAILFCTQTTPSTQLGCSSTPAHPSVTFTAVLFFATESTVPAQTCSVAGHSIKRFGFYRAFNKFQNRPNHIGKNHFNFYLFDLSLEFGIQGRHKDLRQINSFDFAVSNLNLQRNQFYFFSKIIFKGLPMILTIISLICLLNIQILADFFRQKDKQNYQ